MSKYDAAMMKTALIWAQESYCKRNKVGAIISRDGRVVSNGYNGTITGADNCCEENVSNYLKCTRCGCSDKDELTYEEVNEDYHFTNNFCGACKYTGFVKPVYVTKSKNTIVHAEANAILFAAKNGIATESCSLYVTLSPCIECAKMAVQCGIKEVIFLKEYRDSKGIQFLKENGVTIKHLDMDEV